MDSISLLLEASEVHSRAEEYSRRASFDDTMCVESQSPEIEAIDAILHLRDSFQLNRERLYGSASNSPVPSTQPPAVKAEEGGYVRPERARRRAMSEPWVTMSPSFTRAHGAGASHFHGGRQSGMTTYGEKTDEGAYSSAHLLHPQLLQPRFPLPVLDPFSPSNAATAGSNVGSAGNAANRVPTMEEFAAIANKNGRIGIYTKEEREFLIQRFRDKKKRRVWKKKIRYECRKDLADRRCRVKGRFVKAAPVTGKHHHANSISSDNTSEETNHSRSSSLGHHESSNNNRLVFRIPRRSNAAASAQSTSSAAHNSTKASAKKRPLKPLMLNMLSSSEDRLKYLTSILGELDPNSPTNPQDDLDDDEDHDDVDDDMDDDMDEDDDEDDTEGSDEMNTNNHHDNVDKPEPRYRTRANSEHSLDYRRVRRHSIAY